MSCKHRAGSHPERDTSSSLALEFTAWLTTQDSLDNHGITIHRFCNPQYTARQSSTIHCDVYASEEKKIPLTMHSDQTWWKHQNNQKWFAFYVKKRFYALSSDTVTAQRWLSAVEASGESWSPVNFTVISYDTVLRQLAGIEKRSALENTRETTV